LIFQDQYPYSNNPQVRLIHAGYEVPPVNIYLDEALVASNLAYTQSSGYAVVSAGTYVAK
jgi:hypothetical protein